jgi:hypothetical protein
VYNVSEDTDTGAGNVLSDKVYGASIYYASSLNTIEGNLICTDAIGEHAITKFYYGIYDNADNDTIAAARNALSGDHNFGVAIETASIVSSVHSNSTDSKTGLGIELGKDRETLNTPDSQLLGPKDFQRYAAWDAAVVTASISTIVGTPNSSPGTTCSMQFFSNPSADPSSDGQDQTYLGPIKVTTDSDADVSFTLTLDIAVPSGQVISTTAADPDGNTSDLCQNLTVTAGAPQVPIRAGSPLREVQPKAVSSESIHALDIVLSSANQPDEAALLELAMELTRTAQPRSKPLKGFQAPSSRFFQRPARGSSIRRGS